MTLFELLFILLVLLSVGVLVLGVVLGTTKGWSEGGKVLRVVGGTWAVYLTVLAIADILAQQHVTPVGEERCFDEMCFTVTSAKRLRDFASAPAPGHAYYVVRVRVTSRSLGRSQAEGGLRARLYQDGKYFEAPPDAQQAYDRRCGTSARLTQRLDPGESLVSPLVFEWSADSRVPPLVLDHGFTPGYLVIGESPFFHKPDIMLIPSVQDTPSPCAA